MADNHRSPIRTLEQFVHRIAELQSDWREESQPEKALWFRGHASVRWRLIPKIYRSQFRDASEAEIRQEFQSDALQLKEGRLPQNPYEWYFLMQHYGAPTRLLGWTDKPLLGLFFAVEEDHPKVDAVVWVLDPWWLNEKLEMPFTGSILPDWQESHFWLYDLEQAFSTNLQAAQELPAAIDPPHVDKRVAVQGSRFVIFGTKRDLEVVVAGFERENRQENTDAKAGRRQRGAEESRLTKIVIKRDAVPQIREQLHDCGINRFSVFPDLENLCVYLRRKGAKKG